MGFGNMEIHPAAVRSQDLKSASVARTCTLGPRLFDVNGDDSRSYKTPPRYKLIRHELAIVGDAYTSLLH